MRSTWEADFEITPAKARMLIERQFPPLAPVRLAPFGRGWDNTAFLINDGIVFRFPRRQIAAPLIMREVQILPLLAPHLPVRIPVPEYAGAPADDYPWAFAGYTLIPGQTACRRPWPNGERAQQAPAVAEFLSHLHRIPIHDQTAAWAPGDEIERANVAQRAPKLIERLRVNAAGLHDRETDFLVQRVEELAAAPMRTMPYCWVHGDFYARHLLYHQNHLAGVIDWGDVHLGDPALDLSIAFSFLPPAARAAFRKAYGEIDAATWQRARFRALHYGAVLVEYGLAIGDTAIQAAGEYALRHAALRE